MCPIRRFSSASVLFRLTSACHRCHVFSFPPFCAFPPAPFFFLNPFRSSCLHRAQRPITPCSYHAYSYLLQFLRSHPLSTFPKTPCFSLGRRGPHTHKLGHWTSCFSLEPLKTVFFFPWYSSFCGTCVSMAQCCWIPPFPTAFLVPAVGPEPFFVFAHLF